MNTKARRTNAWVAAFAAPPRHVSAPLGHNQGPPLAEADKVILWRKALRRAWRGSPVEVVRRRVALAAEAGISYHDYTLEILERGRWLVPEKDAERIAEIRGGA